VQAAESERRMYGELEILEGDIAAMEEDYLRTYNPGNLIVGYDCYIDNTRRRKEERIFSGALQCFWRCGMQGGLSSGHGTHAPVDALVSADRVVESAGSSMTWHEYKQRLNQDREMERGAGGGGGMKSLGGAGKLMKPLKVKKKLLGQGNGGAGVAGPRLSGGALDLGVGKKRQRSDMTGSADSDVESASVASRGGAAPAISDFDADMAGVAAELGSPPEPTLRNSKQGAMKKGKKKARLSGAGAGGDDEE
jgi:hypothetical protein